MPCFTTTGHMPHADPAANSLLTCGIARHMKDILLLALLLAIMAGSLYGLPVGSTHGASSPHLIVEAGVSGRHAFSAWFIEDFLKQQKSRAMPGFFVVIVPVPYFADASSPAFSGRSTSST